jgi:hypothetical protein
MAMLLKDLYKDINHEDMKLVAGAAGMNRSIRWMHMVEGLEISSFLRGEEIAFITGIAMRQAQTETLLQLLRSIYEHGGSAVVINIGMYIKEIPQEAIDFCNQTAMPLFEVPWSVHMAEIMHVFAQKITEDEQCSVELKSALKYALYTPLATDTYIPVFEQNGFPAQGEYRLAVIRYETERPLAADEQASVLEKISRQSETALDRRYACRLFPLDGNIILLAAAWPEDCIRAVLEAAVARIQADLSDIRLYVSVSMAVPGLEQLHDCYVQLRKMYPLHNRCGRAVLVYDELGAYKVILDAEHPAGLMTYYRSVLGPLEEYDQLHHSQLLDALKVYLETNGSIHQTADILYIHRNTVTYKIHKAEEILGCDMSLFSTRFSVQLAMMIKNIM